MKVLITGAGGMVGRAVSNECQSFGDEVLCYDRQTLDIADNARVIAAVTAQSPDVVINCAAWTDVDGCESDPLRAEAANARGPENLAIASWKAGSVFITISTDYVFDGEKDGFYTQRDQPNPLSVYAKSKLEGEHRAQIAYARTVIVRSGFIFGPGGRNFLSTFLDRARKGERLTAISDSTGTPTYSLDLAKRLRELALLDLPGVYHVVNSGPGATYREIVDLGLEGAGISAEVLDVSEDSLQRPAPRPRNSRLQCLLSERIGLRPVRFWQDALTDFAGLQLK